MSEFQLARRVHCNRKVSWGIISEREYEIEAKRKKKRKNEGYGEKDGRSAAI